MDGTYTEGQVAFRQGAISQPITVRAQNKWKAILNSTADCNPAISVYASYITIENLRISGTGRCTVYELRAADAAIIPWEAQGPTISGTHSTGYVGFVARGLYIDAGRGLGIKVRQDNALVENCEIHNSLENFNNIGTIFRNNTTYGHDQFGSSIFAKGGSRNTLIYNNVVHLMGADWTEGILLGGSSGVQWDYDPATGIECYNCVAYNNVVINETGNATGVLGMAGCQDCAMFNNIGINGSLFMRGGGSGATSRNPVWKNNILSCGNNSPTTSWAYVGTMAIDYNDIYCGGAPGQNHAIAGNPMFVNPASDWHLQPGSPALGSGVATPTTPAFGGGTLDTSKNTDGNVRTAPWNLGIH